jgi:hypothetical protein
MSVSSVVAQYMPAALSVNSAAVARQQHAPPPVIRTLAARHNVTITLPMATFCFLQSGLQTTAHTRTALVLVYKILDPGLILSQAPQTACSAGCQPNTVQKNRQLVVLLAVVS